LACEEPLETEGKIVQRRYLMVAALFLALTVVPTYAMPNGLGWAYAATLHGQVASGDVQASSPVDERAVASSNENEQKDREDRRDHGNNANDNNGNGNDSDDNEDNGGGSPPPPPPASRPAPQTASNQASGCLQSGGSVSLTLSDGTVTAKVFQDNLNVVLDRVDAGSVPGPAGGIIGDLIFRVSASPCGGAGLASLPGEGNLGVGYRNRVADAGNESKFTLMFWDGQKWSTAPKQTTDTGANYVSATITALGVYAVVQQ